ncbi:protein LTV1 homolog [Pygocentrus nattereri]|uniref:Protein LTV1 homolog n=1 Tax=Pygocentrus nattereri TaxID=42514 RepID=A0A3B4E361_PYGNA|nr:protein LTV1 homolog [Pygocentrus nattereri]XP_037399002.1 protein LTV1 homolog [Pygocentrus nattereri]XP_037399003.1 protein LTV1 homolog [Pygocentrus nattereri]
MPHRKKKSFISKKNAVSFHLVHRSQKDPLAADEKAPQHVLLPASKIETEKRKEEQRKFGVFFDDDYDYLQHLRETAVPTELVSAPQPRQDTRSVTLEEEEGEEEAASINLPSSVFASEFEEEVGLLNKAAPVSGPRLDLDPDIVAALDDDFDFDDPENMLDDDFVVKANDTLPGDANTGDEGDDDEWTDEDESVEEEDEQNYDSAGGLSEDGDEYEGGERLFAFMDCETKSRFTEYSLSSSVMRRNEQLALLDERFEKFFEQFDDDEIGALDNAELEGYIDPGSMRLEEVIKDYFKQKEKEYQKPEQLGPAQLPSVKEEEEEGEVQEMETLVIEEPPVDKWDCETIISTYSNIYNHPKLIEDPPKLKQIRVSNKTGIPLDVLPKKGLTARQVERMERINDSDLPRASTQPRSREESKEDRKLRKQAIKDERKERRMEKKANKVAFKQEKIMQEKQMVSLRANVQGMKLS